VNAIVHLGLVGVVGGRHLSAWVVSPCKRECDKSFTTSINSGDQLFEVGAVASLCRGQSC
jgi:hypothetical protein